MTDKEFNKLNKTLIFLKFIENRMVEDLKVILQGDFGLYNSSLENSIEFLDFEINMDGYSVNLYPYDKNLTQMGFKQTLPEYPDGFIRENNLGLDLYDYDFDKDSDLKRMDEYYSKLETEFIKWFAKCWDKAGGKEIKYPFYIAFHDSTRSFRLKDKCWVDNNQR